MEREFVDLLGQAKRDVPANQVLVSLIAQIMTVTESNAVRNAAALALVDMNATDQATAIIDLVRRPELADRSGTLLFALDELQAALPLDVLLGLIEHGSYEARAEALLIAREGRLRLPDDPEEVAQLSRKLDSLAASTDSAIGEAARLARGYLP